MNANIFMNIRIMTREENIILDCIASLQQLLPNVRVNRNTNQLYDAMISINGIDFVVLVKSAVKRESYLVVLNELNMISKAAGMPALLMCEYVSSSIMSEIAKEKLNVLEVSGNCYIAEGNLMMYVSGRKHVQSNEKTGKAFNETGIKLVYYFLTGSDNVGKSYRSINEETGVSLGAITNIIEELKNMNFVALSAGKRILVNRIELLNQWQQSYNKLLKPKLMLGRMKFRDMSAREQWSDISLPVGAYWAGESAANKIDGYLHPELYTIYTEGRLSDLMRTGKIVPDPNGEISVYRVFWNSQMEGNVVNNVLIYADLMGSGFGRCLEAAQRILSNAL